MLGDPRGRIFAADHEAADILEEEQGDAPLLRQFDEMRALDRAFAEQHAIVREDRDRDAPDMREAADKRRAIRSEEHPSELQSLMRISYAVFCLKKKNYNQIERSTLLSTTIHNYYYQLNTTLTHH